MRRSCRYIDIDISPKVNMQALCKFMGTYIRRSCRYIDIDIYPEVNVQALCKFIDRDIYS